MSPTTNDDYRVKTKKTWSLFGSNYILRDLSVWFVFIVLLPLALFSLYYFAKDSPGNAGTNKYINDKSNELYRTSERNFKRNNYGFLKRVMLDEYESSLCNDGSTASYYIRLSNSLSKDWIIQLEGGYFCYDTVTCKQRSINSNNLTSSVQNKMFKSGSGILSSSIKENKYWSDVNTVNIPYCSSDLWIGNKKCEENCSNEYHFLGQQILDDVITDLFKTYDLQSARQILLVGISAGGMGVLLNSNKIKERIEERAPLSDIKAIIDSSWLLDLPYSFLCNKQSDDTDESLCFIHKIFAQSIDYWKAKLPEECKLNFENIWDCFLPYKIAPYLKVPLFIVQSLFDETQFIEQHTIVSNMNKHHKGKNKKHNSMNTFASTINFINLKIRDTLKSVGNYFVPACISHMILSRSDWNKFRINDEYLEDALYKWTQNTKDNIQLIEDCSWINCNKTCPQLRHPETNKIINPIEYFSYFGI